MYTTITLEKNIHSIIECWSLIYIYVNPRLHWLISLLSLKLIAVSNHYHILLYSFRFSSKFFCFPSSELLYPFQLLEGDGVSAAGLRQDFSVCHSELHWWALHGSGQRPAGRLTFSVCTQCAGWVGQGRGAQGAWTPKAGDDSPDLSHSGALWLRSGCKDSPVCCQYLRMEAVSQTWGT